VTAVIRDAVSPDLRTTLRALKLELFPPGLAASAQHPLRHRKGKPTTRKFTLRSGQGRRRTRELVRRCKAVMSFTKGSSLPDPQPTEPPEELEELTVVTTQIAAQFA
jgi:hypothetical protein